MTTEMPRFSKPALCDEESAELFFPEKGGSSKPAKDICNGYGGRRPPCPAREECLVWALAHHPAGIWGGKSELERKRIAGYRPECGTPKGYKYHQKRREAACDLCRGYRPSRRAVA